MKRVKANVATARITSEGDVFLDQQRVAVDRISGEIRLLIESNDKLIISVKTEEGTTYGSLVDVLNRIKSGGALRITINDPNL